MIARKRIFYGWWILAALVVVGCIGPMARYGVTAFFPAFSSELGWSRSLVGTAQSISLWAYSFFSIITGFMLDRIGSRKTIMIGGILCLVGWLLLSSVRSVWQLYLYYGLVMGAAVSFSHLVVVQATSRKWFVRHGGLAGGIVGSAFAFGTAVFSPLLTSLVSVFDWRQVSVVAAFVSGIPILALAYFVIRDTPESMGLHPDGDPQALPVIPNHKDFSTSTWTVQSALKTRQFWQLFISYSLIGVVYNGLLAHLVVWATDLGSTVAAAGIFVTLFNGPSIPARIIGGTLGDHYGKRRIILLGLAISLAMVTFGWLGASTPLSLGIFAVLVGVGIGFSNTTFAPYLGDLYGRENVGSLFGILTLGWGLIGGVGPMVWGEIYDLTGTYTMALLVSVLCYAVALTSLLLVKPLKEKRTELAPLAATHRG